MAMVIAKAVMKQADISLEKGKDKYNYYFTKSYFLKYKAETDSILTENGYEEVISE